MPALSKYEGAAKAFLAKYPIGTLLTMGEIVDFAQDHKNGLAADALISDPVKCFGSVRRHLNDGGASQSLPEDKRFHLAIMDAKRKTSVVQQLAEHVSREAEASFGKSVVGAINPLKRSKSQIEGIKLDELPEDQRKELEAQLADIVKTTVPVQKLLNDQVIGRWIGKLEARGYTEQQARHLIEVLPTMNRLAKLLKQTSE